ncbi:MAG TPA: hypothetical protein EYN66_08110, partial [Myxococcales bacterium]|nr:hypothetical protein [Myxococcales bacterium]
PDDLFDGHTYAKGAWILHMLRVKLGDKAFQAAVRYYVQQFQNKSVESDDLRRAFETSSGHELKAFFEQWVHRPGHPKLDIHWSFDAKAKIARIKIKQTGTVYKIQLPIHVQTKAGEQVFTPTIDGAEQEVTLPLDSEPEMIEFDRYASLLAEWKITKHLDEWVHQIAQGKSALTRQRAAKMLSKFKRPNKRKKAARALEGALANTKEFYWVRSASAGSLGVLKDSGSKGVLIKALKDKNSRVRTAAASALGNFKGKSSYRALANAFENDASYKTAAAAIRAYARVRSGDAMGLIDDALDRNSHNERIRSAAILALEEVDTAKAFNRVLDETAWGRPDTSRSRAAEALGRMAAGNNKRLDNARDRLTELLNDPRFWVRYSAIKGLKALNDPKAIDALKKAAEVGVARRIIREAERAIRKLEDTRDAPPKAQLMQEVKELKRTTKDLEKRIDTLENGKK